MRKRLPLCPFVVCCCNIKSSCKNRVQKVIPDRRRFCWFRQKTLLCWRLSRLFEFPKRKWCKEWHFYCHHVLPEKNNWNRNHFKYFHVKTIFRFFRSFAIFLVKLKETKYLRVNSFTNSNSTDIFSPRFLWKNWRFRD